jgi:hypothetical protein
MVAIQEVKGLMVTPPWPSLHIFLVAMGALPVFCIIDSNMSNNQLEFGITIGPEQSIRSCRRHN